MRGRVLVPDAEENPRPAAVTRLRPPAATILLTRPRLKARSDDSGQRGEGVGTHWDNATLWAGALPGPGSLPSFQCGSLAGSLLSPPVRQQLKQDIKKHEQALKDIENRLSTHLECLQA
ncbi:hypothetical protein NDU88_005596 [Pleurodeles waltl]|uniref:Uncharacterized protein n=1 Tax=Pleurodeles waltl TaxID=8319 RepID=A0AAV7SMC7_PLEWA|nr:hypothetical protein NDU88_005596 [Pleurodeles waltl]